MGAEKVCVECGCRPETHPIPTCQQFRNKHIGTDAESKARKILKTYFAIGEIEANDGLVKDIAAVLRAEREECAAIADDHNGCTIKGCYGGSCGGNIAAEIRGRK